MPRTQPTPLDRESHFGVEELFYSTTDRKGLIRSGNDVFVRVSGWSFDELRGAPHNIIRHPDMPRAVFKLLWDHLQAGKMVAAYVKNMAKDGSFYWVMAVVEPAGDGYLSVRLKPTSALVPKVAEVYAAVQAEEQRLDALGLPRLELLDASTAFMLGLLAEAGFESYDTFMRVVLPAELSAREAAQDPARRGDEPTTGDGPIAALARSCTHLHGYLASLFTNLDEYRALNTTLTRKSGFVLGLADDIRLFSLNALIASTHLEHGGATLSVISDIMRDRSRETAGIIGELDRSIAEALPLVQDLGFAIAIAKLQTEMTAHFARALLRGDAVATAGGEELIRDDISSLSGCLSGGVFEIFDHLSGLEKLLADIGRQVGRLAKQLHFLSALHTNGRVESARLADASSFARLFEEIGSQIAAANAEMREFASIAAEARRLAPEDGATQARLHLEEIAACVSRLQAATLSTPLAA